MNLELNGVNTLPNVVSEVDLANFLGRSLVTMWRYRQKGLITHRKIAGRIYYLKEDIVEFLDRFKTPAIPR